MTPPYRINSDLENIDTSLREMKDIDWTAWFCTILLIIVFREGAVELPKSFTILN